ncbi:glycosyltransferase [Hordeum vulgare]|nr:glycosyltransferase [Hordeum vulgare]
MVGRHVRGARVGLSDHHVIDLLHDKRTHYFSGVIVGTRFHDILAVETARTRDNQTFVDFHDFLLGAYKDDNSTPEPQQPPPQQPCRLRLGLIAQGEPGDQE